jgi:LuxR family maltose regulon positive regulatory protein
MCEKHAGRRCAAASQLAASLAAIHYEWGDLDKVEELLADRLDVIDSTSYLDPVLSAYTSLTRLWIARAEFTVAHQLLDRAELVADRHGWLRLTAACAAERTRLWLLEGRPVDADRSVRRILGFATAIQEQGANTEIVILAHIARARQLIHKRRFNEATAILQESMTECEATTNLYVAHQLRILLALALEGGGYRAAAHTCLTTVLEFGESANLIRSIADEGPVAAHLIGSLWSAPENAQPPSEYRARLQRELGLPSTVEDSSSISTGEPGSTADHLLTAREQHILDLLAQGLANKQIAKALMIAPETVKWHLKNVYTKLGVSGRAHAAHLARQISLRHSSPARGTSLATAGVRAMSGSAH